MHWLILKQYTGIFMFLKLIQNNHNLSLSALSSERFDTLLKF